ncbi:hypothetical protein MAMP_00245 [Methylophaga aminisulfidivorans MP]|uniref:GmrSD restriction endonucleases N-terminal domain-containing protein n=1 Tax=Methylophaga aminisulfidivorans MP TaxID=1026882 RepID=F5T1H9_9GAMM|nr:DUF262 domain-containing protein [Methylophaga aminisulfidivorans]EGL53075.1 hypothetical protein MAMP_00245 [Methylophaga aminisulfidivorans MP]
MAGEYEKALTIKEAIDAINNRDFLLPAIQRKFVWSSHQICVLFDSIMRGYPINTFMMWEVNDDEIKNGYKFYEFLSSYCQRFNEENPIVKTNAGFKNFKAIIDGQQRLTSLYIGLCGTYAYKQPRVWWPNTRDDNALPPRKFYLDLASALDSEDDESLMLYNFKFLTDKQYQNAAENPDSTHHWFCVHKILEMPQVEAPNRIWSGVLQPYIEDNGLQDNQFAKDALGQLYDVIRSIPVIHYFNETSQQIDHVLDVFIRTNSGGTKLDFSDLLMSIAIAHWDGDFRQELEDLTKQIHQSSDMGFYMERDWVLKTCLMLCDVDVRFKVRNFKSEQVELLQTNWKAIKECIKQTLILVRRFGINPQSLTSKNAVIPICYYLFKKQQDGKALYESINNLAKHYEQREVISRWLYMALLKGVFGGQADTILSSMRDVLSKHIDDELFPLDEIIERYRASNKDLRFDEDYIDSLLSIQYGEGRCRALLHLLFPEMRETEVFHIDHLHPKASFELQKLKANSVLADDEELMNFFSKPEHWNSIPNLHLLNDSQNISKKDRPLDDWLSDGKVNLTPETLLVNGVDLRFEAFPEFFATRRQALRDRLKSRVMMSTTLPAEPSDDDSDEEVVEEALA